MFFCFFSGAKAVAIVVVGVVSPGHYVEDAWDGPPEDCTPSPPSPPAAGSGLVDLLWVDFGVGPRLEEFLQSYWRCVAPGGLIVIHSTLTNKVTREWLERVRRGEVDFGAFDDDAAARGGSSGGGGGGGSGGGSGGKKRKKGAAGGVGEDGGGGGGSSVHHVSLLARSVHSLSFIRST